jgi:hypothetical protein
MLTLKTRIDTDQHGWLLSVFAFFSFVLHRSSLSAPCIMPSVLGPLTFYLFGFPSSLVLRPSHLVLYRTSLSAPCTMPSALGPLTFDLFGFPSSLVPRPSSLFPLCPMRYALCPLGLPAFYAWHSGLAPLVLAAPKAACQPPFFLIIPCYYLLDNVSTCLIFLVTH